jgi:hypothetical protein
MAGKWILGKALANGPRYSLPKEIRFSASDTTFSRTDTPFSITDLLLVATEKRFPSRTSSFAPKPLSLGARGKRDLFRMSPAKTICDRT